MSPGYILVIDDNPENLKLVTRYLGAKGFRVEAVHDAKEADAALAREWPRMALVDISLPDEDGLSWVRRTVLTEGPPIHFVALTANSLSETRERARAAGCSNFLTKPVPLKELLSIVNGCFGLGDKPEETAV